MIPLHFGPIQKVNSLESGPVSKMDKTIPAVGPVLNQRMLR